MRIGVVFPQTELAGDVGAVRAYGRAVPAGLDELPERLPALRAQGQAQLNVVYRDLIERLITSRSCCSDTSPR